MTVPDAETYLRCRLEDALIAGEESGRRELARRVRAALAIRAVDDHVAELVLADADRAFGLRSGRDFGEDEDADERSEPPRVVVCPTVIEQDWGTLTITHVVLGEYETTLGVSGRLLATSPGSHRHGGPWQSIEVLDAAGARFPAYFSGGSSDTSFDGEYTLNPGLDPAVTTVTVAGHPIELAGPPTPAEVRLDLLTDMSSSELGRRHLRLVSSDRPRMWDEDEVQLARETLADLGLIDADEPALADARPGRHPGRHGRRDTTPSRWLAIGATTPPVDGLVLTLTTLTDDGRVSYTGISRGRQNAEQDEPLLRVGAVDDLGRRHTGEPEQSSSGGRSFQATVRLLPELDVNARLLTVVVDTLCHQVLIDVPLDWQEAR